MNDWLMNRELSFESLSQVDEEMHRSLYFDQVERMMKQAVSCLMLGAMGMVTLAIAQVEAEEVIELPKKSVVQIKTINELNIQKDQEPSSILVKPSYAVLPDSKRQELPNYCIGSGKAHVAQNALSINLDRFFCITPEQKVFDMQIEASGQVEPNQQVGVECLDSHCEKMVIREGVEMKLQLNKAITSKARRVYE